MAYPPGVSGNPGGRPIHTEEVRQALELAKQATGKAIQKLIELIDNSDPRVAVVAVNSLLDRALGKPQQAIQLDGKVAHFVARLPGVVEKTVLWMEQTKKLSGSPNQDHKPTT